MKWYISLLCLLVALPAWAAPARHRTAPAPQRVQEDTVVLFRGFADLRLPEDSTLRTDFPVPSAVDLRTPIFDDYRLRPYPSDVVRAPQTRAQKLIDTPLRRSIDDHVYMDSLIDALKQNYMVRYPEMVKFNVRSLPDPPKRYRSVVDPSTLRIVVEEIVTGPAGPDSANLDVDRINWLHNFDGSMQFSQAYISPNWYQGGNNALSMIGAVNFGVKLNRKFYPKLMLEADVSYKLALASTPDDSIRHYSVTEDIFQVTAKGGFKAMKNWFYSVSLNFKTQFLNSYPINSNKRAASFLSPGELNLGFGMTYDLVRPNKVFVLNASISPLSWNLKTCIDHAVDPETNGIEPGHRTLSKIGSSMDVTCTWKVTRDITYNSRLFGFTDYEDTTLDWENTIDFAINRFLSTRLYMHLRYDSSTPPAEDSRWHHWQFKEILSLGFQYHFSTI